MPSLRKRAPRAEPVPAADGGRVVPQAVVDAALADAQRVADAVPPNAEITTAVPPTTDNDAGALRSQLAALRDAEQRAQRTAESQSQIEAAMSREGVPASAPDAAPQQQARIEFTPAEESLHAAYPGLLSDQLHAQAASAAVGQLAQAGLPRGSAGYEANLRTTFETLLSQAKAAAAPRPVAPAAPAPDPEPARNFSMQAPVSRTIPMSDGTPLRGKVTLTAEELQLADSMGVDRRVWAANKLKLQTLQKQGFYREGEG